jgi:hypothetical protein
MKPRGRGGPPPRPLSIQKAHAASTRKKTVFTAANDLRLGGGAPPRLMTQRNVRSAIMIQNAAATARVRNFVRRA